jgi:radical SAM superfamily enzyme YgiQ (UPF0313 family)
MAKKNPYNLEDLNLGGRVLFVIPDNFQEDNVFPLGPGYLAACLQLANVEVETYCMDVFHYSLEELEQFLTSNTYDLICLSFMAPRFKRGVQAACNVIKKAKNEDAWFVLGGYGPSPIPDYMLKTTGADIVAIGEGEETLIEIMMARQGKGMEVEDIKSIAYLKDGETIINERRGTIKYLNELPFPAWDIFPMEKYTTCLKFSGMDVDEKAFPLISTRGCTDKCSFCFRLDSGIRQRGPDAVVAEMKELHDRYGVTFFYFCDELAIVSKKQILQLTDSIKKNLPPIKFRMDCRVTLFDDEIAVALKQAGAVFLNIGFESSSQKVLDQMNKRATIEQNIDAAEMAMKHGIGIGINMIWGMPSDDLDSLRMNAEFIKRFNQYDQIRTIRPVTPYPGSPLYQQAVREGQLEGPDDFFEKFKNSDLYLCNYIGIPKEEIYATLYEVNKDLIYDHFEHTSKDFEAADRLLERFFDLYFNGVTDFSGPRHQNQEGHSHVKRPDAGITMGVWDGVDLGETNQYSGM